jgi:hypothetical protein
MTGTPPPWQATYDRFRHLYPTGGLLLDLAATPTSHCPQYVVKATAQIGHLTLLSVLGEAPLLQDAETQACYKLFQILKLTGTENSAQSVDPLGLNTSPPMTLPLQEAPALSKLLDQPKSIPTPAERPSDPSSLHPIPLNPNPLNPIPQNQNTPNPNGQNPNGQNPHPKSEPYRMVQPVGREEIMAPEVDDWSEELAQIEVEVKRLGWTPQQESQYLQQYYGKLSRDHITDYGELLQFLTDLQGHPSPQAAQGGAPSGARQDLMDQVLAEIHRIGWTARQGSEYLQQTYQVKTRQELTNDQLQEFIIYLQHHP